MRHQLSFACDGAVLAASLDDAPGTTGLLIVSGGNEVRSGAHRGMAMLAQGIAAAGHPVFRFDRRGIGDSEGTNGGYESSGPDIVAAIAAFRQVAPHVHRIIAFGNCDAASALVLHQPLAIDALILANPWAYDGGDHGSDSDDDEPALPPASAIRARYLSRLKDPKSLIRLLKGDISLGKVFRGLSAMSKSAPPPTDNSLAERLASGLIALPCPARILLATGDRTAMAFAEHWCGPAFDIPREGDNVRAIRLDSVSHSFAGNDADWLEQQILAALAA